jgi:hypothetical protein
MWTLWATTINATGTRPMQIWLGNGPKNDVCHFNSTDRRQCVEAAILLGGRINIFLDAGPWRNLRKSSIRGAQLSQTASN